MKSPTQAHFRSVGLAGAGPDIGDFHRELLTLGRGKARALGADYDTADDIAQEIALDQWQRQVAGRPGWQPDRSLATYIAGAVSKRLLERRRKELRRREPHAEYEYLRGCKALTVGDHHRTLELKGLLADLERTLAAMSHERLTTFSSIRSGEATYAELAEQRLVSEGTLRVLVHRASQELEAVRRHHEDLTPKNSVEPLRIARPLVDFVHQGISMNNGRVSPRSGTDGPPQKPGWLERLSVRRGGRTERLDVEEIDWFVAADYCVRLRARGRDWIVRAAMVRLAARLNPARFIRSHRSAIVNISRVKEIQHSVRKEHAILLHDGTRLPLSRARLTLMETALQWRS